MPTLTIRSVPQEVHERLKGRAARNRRSLNAEALSLLEQALEALPEEVELREWFRALRRQTRWRSPPAYGPGDRAYGTDATSEPTVRESTIVEPAGDPVAIKRLLRDQRDRLRAFGVRRIGLFGSVLRGEGRSESDVDLLVEFDPARKSFDGLLQLASYLEDLLQRKVDLITTEGLSPYIGPKILRDAEFVRVSD